MTSIDIETHRYRAEVRHVLALAVISRVRSDSYLARVEEQRGKEVAEMLRRDAREQWAKGAKGEWGVWL